MPISRADLHLVPTVEKSFALFPPGPENDLLVVGSPNVRETVEIVSEKLSGHFKTTTHHIFQQDNHLGWPMACGYYFQQTAYKIQGLDYPEWLWFEPDCTPIVNNWLTRIETAYRQQPNPFMGWKEATVQGFNGSRLPIEESGYHMSPCGVYPNDAALRIIPLKGLHVAPIRWPEFIQWYVVNQLTDSKLIQNNWRTVKYRKSGDSIVCQSDARLAWDVHYNRPINDDAVVVHGCKDGSLLEVFANKEEMPYIVDDHTAIETPKPERKIEKDTKPIPRSRRMSKSARKARILRYQAQQFNMGISNG